MATFSWQYADTLEWPLRNEVPKYLPTRELLVLVAVLLRMRMGIYKI
jgi:hypothetical protein